MSDVKWVSSLKIYSVDKQKKVNRSLDLVSMNYQTAGKFMDIYFGRFLSNGGCGYVLKPTYLRYDNAAAAATASSSMVSGRLSTNLYSSNTPQILHIKVKFLSKKTNDFIVGIVLFVFQR